ncbi:adenosine receptor A1-like [Apostichopus japonicus]|uniref:adenosine receptor A1-like n=1 Tax=Stichopus japonicus TaxID=307972 RepID=UPI003AB5562E
MSMKVMNISSEASSSNIGEVTPDLVRFTVLTTVPVALFGSFGNICVILVFIKKRHIRTVSNNFTVVLMFFCLINDISAYPMQSLFDLFFFTTQPSCYLGGSPNLALSIQITFCLLATTVERYITICRPLTANTILTPRRSIIALASIAIYGYTYGIVVSGLLWIGKGHIWRLTRRCNLSFMVPSKIYGMILVAHWMLPIPIMTFIHAHIFWTVRRHIREIAATSAFDTRPTTGVSASIKSTPQTESNSGQPARERTRRTPARNASVRNHSYGRMMREAKSALRLFIVLTIYVINWVPFTLFLLTGVITPENVSPKAYVLLHLFAHSTGFFCPYIYGFGNKTIREEIKKMLKCPSRWQIFGSSNHQGSLTRRQLTISEQ